MKSNIKELDALTLNDGRKYLVSSIAEIENKKYLFLVDMDDNTNIKLMEERINGEEIHLFVLEDQDLIAKLLPEFLKGSRKAISELRKLEENDKK